MTTKARLSAASALLVISLTLSPIECNEHKVHNIVLYPDKHSWCQTQQIQQVVGSPGYDSVTIDNNICVGACFSYSIPKSQPAEPGELIRPYCDSCQPSKIECYHVNLISDKSSPDLPQILQKRIQIITNCSCQTCGKERVEDCEINDENTLELPRKLYTDHNSKKAIIEEKPELFEVQNTTHRSTNTDDKYREDLKKWFATKFNGSEEEGDSSSGKNTEIYFANINEEDNAKIEQDLEGLADDFGIEGVPSGQQGAHIGLGIHQNEIASDGLERKHHNHHNHHHGHHPHHVGEEQYIGTNVAHLIKGPHDSMVLVPGEAKIHIDTDSLKPNDEGIIIEYENHGSKNHNLAKFDEN